MGSSHKGFDNMRVLFLTNIPSPYRVDFFNELGKLVDLTVIFERKSSDERSDGWIKYNFENFKAIFLKGYKIGPNESLSFEVLKYLKHSKYNHIILGGYSTPTGILASIYMKLRRIKYILNIDGGLIKKNSKVQMLIKKFLLNSPEYYLSPGLVGDKYLVHYGVEKSKIYNYPFTSVKYEDILKKPLEANEKSALKKELELPNRKTIISVGRFIYGKGFDLLLKAMKNVEVDLNLLIIGGTPTQEYLDLINKNDLKNIQFLNFMGKEELSKYYIASDLFILPTREDIWGLVINEAMAKGLPVITTDKCVAGLEMIEENKNGYLYSVEDIETLSNKINSFFRKKEREREEMSLEALKSIRKYSIENMAEEHSKIFNKIIENKKED